jgi:hypothetical protein
MRLTRKATAAAAIMIWASLFVSGQKAADMAGTWSGDATLESMPGSNTLTLVLEIKGGKLAGHMTDQYGSIDGDIKDVVFGQGIFNFKIPVVLPQGGQGTMIVKMKVSGDTMKGEIEIPEMGAKGAWEAAKQK